MADLTSHKIQSGPGEELVERRSPRDYYIMLRERLWVALPIALLVSVGYFYYEARQTPMYAAVATMQFEKPDTIVTTQGVVDPAIHSEMDINTYLQVLNSSNMRARVVDSFTADDRNVLLRPAMKKLPPGQPPPPVGAMLGSVSFDAIRNSFLISITAHNEDPDAAALVANHYVKQFMEELFEEVGGKNEYAVSFLKDRAEELRKQSEASEARLEQYMQDNHVVSLDKDMNIVSDRLKAVDAALTADKLSLINLQDLAQQVEDYQRNHRDLLEISYIAQHGSVPRLRSQLSDLVQQQSSLSERYLERHPKMIAVADNIRSTQEQIAREIAQAVGDLKASLAEAARNVQALEADYAQNEKAELQLRALSVNYNTLANQESVAKNNYLQILDRLNQNTTSKNLEKIPLHPLDWATANYTPYAPSIPKIARTAASLGVLVFIGVAVGLSFVDDRIKSTWDVEAFLGVNLLGIVPDLANVNSDEKYTLLADSEHVTGGEAFLGIYSAVKIHSKLDFPKSILVTSTIPGEGKTLVSSNLAGCFARHGKNTLLIDCDLRRPMIHRHFKQQNKAGVIAWFESGGNLEGDLATNPNLGIVKISENLSVLTSGGRAKSPTQILENPLFGQLLEKLKKQYDLIVVDSPPMGAVTDALLIAERTDEVVYVCRFNRAYRKHIKLYIRALMNGKNVVLGIVLNGLSPRRIEYYSNYRYYRSYKKYYSAQT
jgi:capsular exopolysaccharide synthesis family protein